MKEITFKVFRNKILKFLKKEGDRKFDSIEVYVTGFIIFETKKERGEENVLSISINDKEMKNIIFKDIKEKIGEKYKNETVVMNVFEMEEKRCVIEKIVENKKYIDDIFIFPKVLKFEKECFFLKDELGCFKNILKLVPEKYVLQNYVDEYNTYKLITLGFSKNENNNDFKLYELENDFEFVKELL